THPSSYSDSDHRDDRAIWVPALAALGRDDSPRLTQLPPHDRGPLGERLQLPERDLAAHVFHAAVGRRDQPVGRDIFQPRTNSIGDLLWSLHDLIPEIDHAEHDRLAR